MRLPQLRGTGLKAENMDTLLETIRSFAKPGVTLGPERRLGELGASSSLGLSMLRAALTRRFGAAVPLLDGRMTIGELKQSLRDGGRTAAGEAKARAATPAMGTTPKSGGGLWGARKTDDAAARAPVWVGHGVDIEEIADFPAWPAADEQARAFFALHFTARELAGAEKHPEPRAHLCGLWCAKEAVRKAVPAAAQADWRSIEVTADESGQPRVSGAAIAGVALALSISHSARQAMASVVVWRT